MDLHRITLPSGTEITSGVGEQVAIAKVQITRSVNKEQALTPGGVCAAMAELELICPKGISGISAGDRLILHRGERQVGVFYARKTEKIAANRCRITAYDPISLLDQDMTGWLENFSQWQCTLAEFARQVCLGAGLAQPEGELLNGELPVAQFSATGITGRQLLQMVCQLGGCFCTADEMGVPRFGWYTQAPCRVAPYEDSGVAEITYQMQEVTIHATNVAVAQGELTGAVTAEFSQGRVELLVEDDLPAVFWYQNTAKRSDYITDPIGGVFLGVTASDTGTCYPSNGENLCVLTGNYLITGWDADQRLLGARRLYERLFSVQTTPCKLRLAAAAPVEAGQILRLFDGEKHHIVYVMSTCRTGGYLEIESTGEQRRQADVLLESQSFTALNGKVLELSMDINGLQISHQQAQGASAALSLQLEGITGQVSAQSEQLTRLQQTAQSLSLTVESVSEQVADMEAGGVSGVVTRQRQYTFDDSGLRIQLSGEQMENRLDHTGMFVSRDGQRVLSATADGVHGVDVTVENYLNVGASRFEEYGNRRTACFFV